MYVTETSMSVLQFRNSFFLLPPQFLWTTAIEKLLEKILIIACKILTDPFDKTFSLVRAELKKEFLFLWKLVPDVI